MNKNPKQAQQPESKKKHLYRELASQAGVKYYTRPEWERSYRAPNLDIEEERAKLQKSTAELEALIVSVADNLKPELDKFGGDDIRQLVQAWKNPSSRVELQQVMEHYRKGIEPYNIRSSDLGIRYQDRQAFENRLYTAENNAFEKKAGYIPSGENLDLTAKKLGLQCSDPGGANYISHQDFRDLVVLDDFPSLVQAALPFVTKYGGQALRKGWEWLQSSDLYTKLVDPREVRITTKSTDYFNPTQTRSDIGVAKFSTYDSVDVRSVAACLIPAVYSHRIQRDNMNRTGLYQRTLQYPLTVGVGGYAVLSFNPLGIASQPDPSPLVAFGVGCSKTSTYDPDLGLLTNPKIFTGPLVGSGFKSFAMVGLTVEYVPTESTMTQQGDLKMWYVSSPNHSLTPSERYSTASWSQASNRIQGTAKIPGRITRPFQSVYHDLDYYAIQGNWPDYDAITIVASGVGTEPGESIGSVYVNLVCEFIPSPSATAQYGLEYPTPAPATKDFLNIMPLLKPGLITATADEVEDFVSRMLSRCGEFCSYDSLVEELNVTVFSLKSKMAANVYKSARSHAHLAID